MSAYEPPLPLTTDPRDIIPELKTVMNDEDVAAWQADPRCLCGCGVATTVERQNKQRVPIHTYRLFASGHEMAMPWRREEAIALHQQSARKARAHQIQVDRCVEATGLPQLIRQWQEANYKGNVHLAYLTGLSARTIRRLAAGDDVLIRKETAARVLLAIGVSELPADVSQAYLAWCRAEEVRPKPHTVTGVS